MNSDDMVTRCGHGAPAVSRELIHSLPEKLRGEQSPRGWGLFLIRNMVDDLHTRSEGGKQTVDLIAFTGLGLTPSFAWATQGDKAKNFPPRLFANLVPGYLTAIDEGWEANGEILLKLGVDAYQRASILGLVPPWWISANDAAITELRSGGHRPQNSQSLRRDLNATLAKEVSRVNSHVEHSRSNL